MVANPRRRTDVTDAGLEVLGRDGGRALTHRAVDAEAGVPSGTCANYFPSRATLMLALGQRVFERLTPTQDRLEQLDRVATTEATAENAAYVAERLLATPQLARALLELRLEASRSPEVREVVAPFLRDGLDADVAHHTSRGLPGGRQVVVLLHHLVNGIVLDQLTVPLEPGSDPVQVVRHAAQRLVEPPPEG